VLYGSTVLVPLLLQTLLGYPALQAGIAMLPRGLGSFLAMPLVGFLMGKIEPRRLLGFGILVASFAFWKFTHLSLDVGYWDFFWPLIIQGSAMGFLFVPLTTITNDPIPKEEMGNATSLFNLMRNIGASIGISSVETLQTRHQQMHINDLVANVNVYSQQTQAWLAAVKNMLISRGSDAVTAMKQAEAVLFQTVQRQAAIMSYNDTFWFLTFMFLCMFPLIFIMRKPKHAGGSVAVH
jgi:DHA2 family multidrug resistance protein